MTTIKIGLGISMWSIVAAREILIVVIISWGWVEEFKNGIKEVYRRTGISILMFNNLLLESDGPRGNVGFDVDQKGRRN